MNEKIELRNKILLWKNNNSTIPIGYIITEKTEEDIQKIIDDCVIIPDNYGLYEMYCKMIPILKHYGEVYFFDGNVDLKAM